MLDAMQEDIQEKAAMRTLFGCIFLLYAWFGLWVLVVYQSCLLYTAYVGCTMDGVQSARRRVLDSRRVLSMQLVAG